MDRSKVIDMYFSIWTNQYPYQLVNYLTELDQKKEWSNEEVDSHWSTVFINMVSYRSNYCCITESLCDTYLMLFAFSLTID